MTNILKELILLKLKLADIAIGVLPADLRETVYSVKQEFLSSLNKAILENSKDDTANKSEKSGLKKLDIE